MKMASHGPDSIAACCMPVAHSGIGMLLISEACGSEAGMGSCIANASMPAPSAILYDIPGIWMLCAQAMMPSHALRMFISMEKVFCSPQWGQKQCSAKP